MKAKPISEPEQDKIIEMPAMDLRENVKAIAYGRAIVENRLDDAQAILDELRKKRIPYPIPLNRRTRFFVKCAKETGCIRLSALVYLAVVKSVNLPPLMRRWHAKAEWWGKQVGLSRAGVLRHFNPDVYDKDPKRQEAKIVARKAKQKILSKWVKVTPTRRGLLLRPTRAAFAEYKRSAKDGEQSRHGAVGHYCLSLTRLLGMNGSIIYRLMKSPDVDGNRRRLGPEGITKRLPWLTIEAARIELTRLHQIGVLQRQDGVIFQGYLYYYRTRNKQDRAKFPE